jgi:uncharacterized protein (TIGR00369 family)
MSLAASLSGVIGLDGPTNVVRTAWDRLHGLPGGRLAFSRLIGRAAAYTGTIDGRVEALSIGHSRVTMRDRPAVRNHLKSVHAIALANLAELAGNAALAYSMPDDARFIVSRMEIDYVKKARGTITAEGECPPIQGSARQEYQVPVTMRDPSGEVVARAVLFSLVGPKKR